MATVHRRDMTSADFRLLASFSKAYLLHDPFGSICFGSIFLLGLTKMTLPVWYKAASGWQLSRYKQFDQQAIGIETVAFRRMCRYIQYKESMVVRTLFRFSMLAVVDDQKLYESPRHRMQFSTAQDPFCFGGMSFGFVLERRRLEGQFRQKNE